MAITLKLWPGKREAANLGGAAVQDVKQDTLAWFHPHRLAMTEHAPVDGEGFVADFVAMRHALGQRSFHAALAAVLELRDCRCRREEVHRHVAAAAQRRLKFFQGEKDFAVVVAGMLLRFDVDRPDLSAVLAIAKGSRRRGRGCDRSANPRASGQRRFCGCRVAG